MINATGSRIRAIRQSQGITIAELAKMVGVSKSLISQVERSEVLPSLPTLEKIAVALKVSISEIFKMENIRVEEEEVVVRKENRKKIIIPNSSMIYHLLTPNLRDNMEFLVIEVPPQTDSKKVDTPFKHDGKEYFLVLNGQLHLILDDKKYVLNEGDSGCFDSSKKHVFKNFTDKTAFFVIAATSGLL
ncbi:MAG: XRE family transcriptional regulator [Dehalobacterium sp.]